MRESVNYNMIPIPEDNTNMNGLIHNNRSIFTNVSTNGYYGYQSPVCLPLNQQQFNSDNGKTQSNFKDKRCGNAEESMDVQYNIEELFNMRGAQVTRKRSWDVNDGENKDFKRRRECEKTDSDTKTKLSVSLCNEEELLRGIHGCSYYHWTASEV